MAIVLLGLLVETTGGCATAGLLEMGDARALMFLPLTLTFDALSLGIASAGRRTRTAPQPAFSMSTWQDPDDWVATCEGPLFCPDHKHFVCTGEPDACACVCEVTLPAPEAKAQVAMLSR